MCAKKVVFIGDTGCGKSSLMSYWMNWKHLKELSGELSGELPINNSLKNNDHSPTIGVEFGTIMLQDKNEGGANKIHFWDTGGQERYKCITRQYYRNCDLIILVYDITNKRSFSSVSEWLFEIRSNYDHDKMPALLLIGNKIDLVSQREVTTKEGIDFAKYSNMMFVETSILLGTNVLEAWRNVILGLFHKNEEQYSYLSHKDYISSSYFQEEVGFGVGVGVGIAEKNKCFCV